MGGSSCSPVRTSCSSHHPSLKDSNGFTSCCPQRLSPVPGTIRTCQKFLIQYNRRQLLVLLQNCTDAGKQCQASAAVTEAQGVTRCQGHLPLPQESGKPSRSQSQEAVCWTESRLKSFRTVLGRRLQRQWSDRFQAYWWDTVTGGDSSRPPFSSAVTDNRGTGDQLEVEALLPYLPSVVVEALCRHFVGNCLSPGWNKHSWLPRQHS